MLWLFTAPVLLYGQAPGDKLDYSANTLKAATAPDGERFQKLIDNVVFTQKGTIIYCDSAFFFRSRNALEAFGRVRILNLADSVEITSRRLTYEGNDRMAKLRENVVYRDDSIVLRTEFLDYDMINRSAKYFNGGKIIDNVNTLTSKKGFYNTLTREVTFEEDVVLINPEYTLKSEDLKYDINTKIATITSPSTIVADDGTVLMAEAGSEFQTDRKISEFFVSEIDSRSYIIKGDRISFDDLYKYYEADGAVEMLGKTDNIIIYGDEARFWQNEGITKVYGNVLMKKIVDLDTMYLTADTLMSVDNEETGKYLLAYYNVKIHKVDLQGISDSLSYVVSDSILYFFRDPVLWNEGSQITADSINVELAEDRIDKLNTSSNSFIVSLDSTGQYNQVKGRKMVATFHRNSIDKVDVNGNGESIYFVLDDRTNDLMGMNKILCSNMQIRFEGNQVNTISFYTNPEGVFVPPHEIKEPETRLQGFTWRDGERPSREDVIPDIYKNGRNAAPPSEEEGETVIKTLSVE
ncbi:MAG: organic solvent tolerance protein OstA [Cyclobacteriaceae bacterium]|nr:organic solvent tolerance protein OstA [Cyclobacteriaceae bacterium]